VTQDILAEIGQGWELACGEPARQNLAISCLVSLQSFGAKLRAAVAQRRAREHLEEKLQTQERSLRTSLLAKE
jgi:hypothetical protein